MPRGARARVRHLLAGADGTDRVGLPCNELLAPLPLIALLVLGLNDWLWKGHAPAWLTGKLSDVAGLFVFPLITTSAFDLVLLGAWRLGARVDFTLRRWKLVVAVALELIGFSILKLWPGGSAALVAVMRIAVPLTSVVLDPTDLFALAVLPFTWWYGRRVLARGAYGRVAWAARAHAEHPFADAVACGADAATVNELHAALAARDQPRITSALDRLRA
jgi:hypothetical protein